MITEQPHYLAPDRFTEIMGSFPTGVAVVTASGPDGVPRGLSTNACCSGSLSPPLVLVSISESSTTLTAIRASGTFMLNYLAAGTAEVCRRFAAKGDDKFSGIAYAISDLGSPALNDYACALADCRVLSILETGDHLLVVGEVAAGEVFPEREPLVYHRRGYFRLSE